MVVAFVCELILPSHRGLTRNRDSLAAGNNDQFWEQYQPTLKRRWCHWMISLLEIPWFTRRHQRRIRASKFLASVASDIDVVTDWLFYIKCVSENGEYYDGDGNQQNNKIPPWLVASVLASCILGTIFWFILATDGAIASPVMRFLGHERLSLGYMLLFCVVLEDLPQVVLTFVIEHYFHADQEFTNIAIMNVVVSLYDTFIKLSEAIDQRRDVVETGYWCKERLLKAHKSKVTCLVPFPDDDHDSGRIGAAHMPPAVDSSRDKLHVSNTVHGGNELEAKKIVAAMKLPPMRFLSSSYDCTIKLWDTYGNNINASGTERKPSRTFIGHSKRVSCIAIIPHDEENANHREITNPTMEEKCPSYFFLTGSYDGKSKLWKTSETACRRTYTAFPSENESASKTEVTSIAYIRIKGEENSGDYFVSGHKSGKARLWDLWSGECLRVFRDPVDSPSTWFFRKTLKIYSLCSMEDSQHFAAGSVDGKLQMWDIGMKTKNNTDTKDNDETSISFTPSSEILSTPPMSSSFVHAFEGHTKTVNAVKCVSPGSFLLSGSEDKTAILWSVSTGESLKIFEGHTGPIHDVVIVDQVTFLTASRDTTIKVWDADSTKAFRTYKNPESITAVSTNQNGCFMSGAENGTIGLWIFSSIVNQHDNPILRFENGRWTCGAGNDVDDNYTEMT